MYGKTLTIILGGGRGTRLFPLTENRSKPAVPLAGKYRLIDIPISNAINSGFRQIFVLTQYQSASLNRHVGETYHFDQFSDAFVEVLAAEQTVSDSNWYQGTADAVRQHWHRFGRSPVEDVVVLSGDQLYRMDYSQMHKLHKSKGCGATVAVQPVTREQAKSFGVLRVNDDGDIIEFAEKPKDPAMLDRFRSEPEVLARLGFKDPDRQYLASMGIYMFSRKFLDKTLPQTGMIDFGHNVLPHALKTTKVGAYVFSDYWEDIGTIKSFYEANLQLCKPFPNFRFYDPTSPIYTRPRQLPASKFYGAEIKDGIIAGGCLIRASKITDSVIGVRTRVGQNTTINKTVVMGADWYETYEDKDENLRLNRPDIGIGGNTHISNAIIDKNARIGKDVKILNADGVNHLDAPNYHIREGIVIVPKNGMIPDGTTI